MQIGDLLHDHYQVLDKLGYGGWSTAWLAYDLRGKGYVAVKIGIADSLTHEVEVHRALSAAATGPSSFAIPSLLDEFQAESPNGIHPCFITPLALGSLRQISFSRLFPLDVSRALAYQLTRSVAFVHSHGFVHGGEWQLCRVPGYILGSNTVFF